MPLSAFVAVLILALLPLPALALGGAWGLLSPLVVFGLVPLLELVLTGDRRNPTEAEEQARRAHPGFDAVLYLVSGLLFLTAAGLVARAGALAPGEALLTALAVGIGYGAVGINVAHELGHRSEALPRWTSRLLLVLVAYPHWRVEHLRGHHARVATPADPATARRGESLYAFLPRTLGGTARSAWALERDRLRGQGRGVLSPHNEVLVGWLMVLLSWALVLLLGGPVALGLHLLAGLVAILLLETVNYIEHYGLARQELAPGRYERTQPRHSWNSERPIGRAMLFELTRHSDHHAYPARPYAVLRHHEEAPELPLGYPGMILLSFFPPVFFRVMERALDEQALAAAR